MHTNAETAEHQIMAARHQRADSSTRQARRQALREFQHQLVERTQRARTDKQMVQKRLAVQAGQQRLLLEVACTSEVIAWEPVTRVPHTRAAFLGLMNCRGRLTGVIDFAAFLGEPAKPAQDTDRLLVLSDALAMPCALRVTQVVGLVSLAGFSVSPPSAGEPVWVTSVLTDPDSQRWRLLDLSALVHDPAFIHVAGPVTQGDAE